MILKKKLQFLFKNFFYYIFKKFYGLPKYPKDITNLKLIKKKFSEIDVYDQIYKIDKNIYEIPKGRVFTDTVEHVAIIAEDIIVPNISYQQIEGELKDVEYNKVLLSGTNRVKKKIRGKVLSLIQGASGNNYFHFLFDIVSKLILLDKNDLLKQIDYFLVPDMQNWQLQILSNFGISKKKLLNSKKIRHLEADIIFALDHIWYNKGFVQEEIKNIPKWVIFSLIEKFLSCSKKFKSSERIFIDRSDSIYNHCKLINNIEIINFLEKYNFKSYQVSKLNFFEQIYLFNNAKIIIGPHGAAFTNIIFSKKGLRLVELIPKNHKSIKCRRFSKILNFDYKRVELDTIINPNGDMKISIIELEKILKKIL
jgi:hypothetical protein